MSWTRFKTRILKKMKKGPSSLEETAKIIARSYDSAIKSVGSGDKVGMNRVIQGNFAGFEQYLIKIFKAQSKSTAPLPLPNLIAKGFPIYWAGAQLSIEKVPATPAPGAIFNISVVINTVDFPGTPVPLPTLRLGKAQTTEQFIDSIVKVARNHLKTVSGSTKTISAYTTVPPPPPLGYVPGPGIVLWTGYLVPE